MPAVSDLPTLLATLRPELQTGVFMFCRLPTADPILLAALDPVVTVREAEGLTVVVTEAAALAHGLEPGPLMRMITLTVHSDLEAVGLTAAFSGALTEAGVSSNVVAGYHHDHIFVPAGQAVTAISALTALQTRSTKEAEA